MKSKNYSWLKSKHLLILSSIGIALLCYPSVCMAVKIPTINIGMNNVKNPHQVATALEILFLLTVLSLAPALLLMTTSFTRLAVVFGFLRQAMGTQQMPPTQILIGLALFLTFYIMQPVWQQANQQAIQPYLNGKISFQKAVTLAQVPLRKFMFRQTRKKDLRLFLNITGKQQVKDLQDIPTIVLIPAFMISELKTAFEIGFILYVPFLIIDMVVSSVLLSMGMMMLPPILISLPFKLLLFVLVDGWNLLVGSLVRSFH